jgi:uncharacterized protein YdhG (YjbR/CyaY superfamily)
MKAKSANSGAEEGKALPPQTVDDYIAVCPEPGRSALKKMRTAIRSVLPGEATEVISYRMPAFKLKKVLVYYAAFEDHTSLFPTAAPIEACKDELAGYSISKGTVRFPLDKPLPISLIKRIVKVRLDQSTGNAKN